MKPKKKPSEWVADAELRQSKHCLSCQAPWKDTIRVCLKAMVEDGRSTVTFAALHRWLTNPDNFDGEPYTLTCSSLIFHIREHERDLHKELSERGN